MLVGPVLDLLPWLRSSTGLIGRGKVEMRRGRAADMQTLSARFGERMEAHPGHPQKHSLLTTPRGAMKTSRCPAGKALGNRPQAAAKPSAAWPPAQSHAAQTLADVEHRIPVPLPAQPRQAVSSQVWLSIQVGKGHLGSSPNSAAPHSLHKQTGRRGRLALDSTTPNNTLLLESNF